MKYGIAIIVVEQVNKIKEENKLNEVWDEFNGVLTTDETWVTGI